MRRLVAVFLFLISLSFWSAVLVALINQLLDIDLELSIGPSDISIPRGYDIMIALAVLAVLFYALGYFIQSDSVARFIRHNKLMSVGILTGLLLAGAYGARLVWIELSGGPAFVAAERDDAQTLRKLFAAGEVSEGDLNDLLHRAIRSKSARAAALLLERRPGPDLKFRYGQSQYTALDAAVLWSSPQMIALLLKAGAPVNARNAHGHTALMQLLLYRPGTEAQKLGILRKLLDAGADPNLGDNKGDTPRAIAHRRQLTRIKAVLDGKPAPR